MQDQIKKTICVEGNQYFTAYGFYICKVTTSEGEGNIINVKVTLVNENDGLQPARVFKINGTLQAIKKDRVRLVLEIHKWAQLDRDAETYWVNKVQI